MPLPKEAIEEYKKLYWDRFAINLSDEEASFRASNLVNLYKAVYQQPSFGMEEARDNAPPS